MYKKHLNLDDLYYLASRHLNFVSKPFCLEKVCLRCLKGILEKMTSKRYLEDVFLRYLKDISAYMAYIS